MQTPKISVITVSFNQGEFIQQAIESVLAQNYPNFEHIVIDGGSTDGTIEILKKYKHLNWVSEPDRSQTHALNKGFKKASGEIIAWLNSDDWYEPGIFPAVVEALKDYPILIGECELTDKQGVRKEIVPNLERNWFDILKYWIFYSSPAQPSIFFTREVLTKVQRFDGTFLDEDLDFCMDYEFWLRLCKLYPMTKRLGRVLSHYRTYESNKTGEMMDVTYREMSRVYSRHANRECEREKGIAYVIPVESANTNVAENIQSLKGQIDKDFEIIVLDFSADQSQAKVIRRQTIELGRANTGTSLRYARVEAGSITEAMLKAASVVRSPLIVFLLPSTKVCPEFGVETRRLFENDNLGLVLPIKGNTELEKHFAQTIEAGVIFRFDSIFSTPFLLPQFAVRQIALNELNACDYEQPASSSPLLFFRKLLMRLFYKGWRITAHCPVGLGPIKPLWADEAQWLSQFQLYINAHLVSSLNKEYSADPFAKIRVPHGFGIVFPDNIVASADKLLKLAPQDWWNLSPHAPEIRLNELVREFPNFAPAWAVLERNLRQNGNPAGAQSAMLGYQRAKEFEAKL